MVEKHINKGEGSANHAEETREQFDQSITIQDAISLRDKDLSAREFSVDAGENAPNGAVSQGAIGEIKGGAVHGDIVSSSGLDTSDHIDSRQSGQSSSLRGENYDPVDTMFETDGNLLGADPTFDESALKGQPIDAETANINTVGALGVVDNEWDRSEGINPIGRAQENTGQETKIFTNTDINTDVFMADFEGADILVSELVTEDVQVNVEDNVGEIIPMPDITIPVDTPIKTHLRVRASNATDNQTYINSEDGYDLSAYEYGTSYIVTGAEMDIAGVADNAQIQYVFLDSDTVEVTLLTSWNSVKNLEVFSDSAGNVTLNNFVHTDVSLGSGGDSNVFINGVKRGNITTGDGDDDVEINALTNNASWSNEINVSTGAGADQIDLTGDKGFTIFDVDAGAGNDQVSVDGEYSSLEVDLGDGEDRLVIAGDYDDDNIVVKGDGATQDHSDRENDDHGNIKPHDDRGHGNDDDGVDDSNPGRGRGGPNAQKDISSSDNDFVAAKDCEGDRHGNDKPHDDRGHGNDDMPAMRDGSDGGWVEAVEDNGAMGECSSGDVEGSWVDAVEDIGISDDGNACESAASEDQFEDINIGDIPDPSHDNQLGSENGAFG